MSVAGYWRNWERGTAWLMREIVFELINGNPYYPDGSKPKKSRELIKISDDKARSKEEKRVSPEELEKARQELIKIRDQKK